MRAACVVADGIGEVRKAPTPKEPKEGIQALARLVRECAGEETVAAIAGGFPGVVAGGVVHYAPNLPEWKGSALETELSRALGTSVTVHNDADCAALGEALYGAGKGARIVAYVGVGTGVGCGRIVEGKIDSGVYDLEAGHQIVEVSEGKTLEEFVSGRAFEKRYGVHPSKAPREGYEEMTPILAAGLFNMILHWSPEVFVLGGSMRNEDNGYRLGDVEVVLRGLPKGYPEMPPLVAAKYKDTAGLLGAAALLLAT